jgi:hypothetical protein
VTWYSEPTIVQPNVIQSVYLNWIVDVNYRQHHHHMVVISVSSKHQVVIVVYPIYVNYPQLVVVSAIPQHHHMISHQLTLDGSAIKTSYFVVSVNVLVIVKCHNVYSNQGYRHVTLPTKDVTHILAPKEPLLSMDTVGLQLVANVIIIMKQLV